MPLHFSSLLSFFSFSTRGHLVTIPRGRCAHQFHTPLLNVLCGGLRPGSQSVMQSGNYAHCKRSSHQRMPDVWGGLRNMLFECACVVIFGSWMRESHHFKLLTSSQCFPEPAARAGDGNMCKQPPLSPRVCANSCQESTLLPLGHLAGNSSHISPVFHLQGMSRPTSGLSVSSEPSPIALAL